MSYIQPENRYQLTLPDCLDNYISKDNPVRFIDAFVDKFVHLHPDVLSGYKGIGDFGRSAYPFHSLLKLYIYGYLNSISSSRKLERETYRNMEMIWLLGNLHPDFKTIADFRSVYRSSIHKCCLSFRRFLVTEGYITGKLVAVDGTKVKAYTNREGLTLEGVNKELALLDKKLEAYLQGLTANDLVETAAEELSNLSSELGVESALLERISELRSRIEKLESEKQYMLKNEMERTFPSDRDARLMRSRQNGFIPAYNVQTVVDAENHMIDSARVTDHPNDFHDLEPSIEAVEKELSIEVEQVTADTGYANEEQIYSLEEQGKQVAVPFVEEEYGPKQNPQQGITFTYDEQTDTFICSQGKVLPVVMKTVSKRGKTYRKYQGRQCDDCPLRSLCTTSKKGRIVYRRVDNVALKQYIDKTHKKEYKELIRKRKSIAEHPFGTIKYWMGQIPILLRGKEKVQVEVDLYSTCYNLKRLTNIETMQLLLQEVQNWR